MSKPFAEARSRNGYEWRVVIDEVVETPGLFGLDDACKRAEAINKAAERFRRDAVADALREAAHAFVRCVRERYTEDRWPADFVCSWFLNRADCVERGDL